MYFRSHTWDHGLMGRPKTGETPIRRFRAPDAVWERAKARAEAEGTTISAVLLAYVTRYGSQPPRRRPPDEETGEKT